MGATSSRRMLKCLDQMSDGIASRLDLDHAWKCAKWDLQRRNFVSHPFEVEIVESALNEWLGRLREEIAAGTYSPKACEIFDYPKPDFLVRPAARLELQDYVVYCALGQAVLGSIHASLRALVNVDYSYQLRSKANVVPWFQSRFKGWEQFREVSLKRTQDDGVFVVFTDLVGFYENIDLGRLKYMLLSAGVEEDILALLMKCLKKWAGPRNRGIPQGTSVSDLLAKLYLEPLDRRLQRDGFNHLRYVDDIRVFCRSLTEAKKAIRTLSGLARERGLNLQSAKTKICEVGKARIKLVGMVPDIEALERELVGEARKQFGWMNPYLYPDDLKELHDNLAEGATREATETAFRKYFDGQKIKFDASLFHYTLKRLGAVRSPIAVTYALKQLCSEQQDALRDAFLGFDNHTLSSSDIKSP